jgi:transcriptional regulator with XRE-family HTH domain
MGRAARRKRHYPKRLGEKLLQIRKTLGLSQNDLLKLLGTPEGLLGTSISGYERGVREPPLLILLEYARIGGICVDVLLDDEVDITAKMPSTPKHKGYKSRASIRSISKR